MPMCKKWFIWPRSPLLFEPTIWLRICTTWVCPQPGRIFLHHISRTVVMSIFYSPVRAAQVGKCGAQDMPLEKTRHSAILRHTCLQLYDCGRTTVLSGFVSEVIRIPHAQCALYCAATRHANVSSNARELFVCLLSAHCCTAPFAVIQTED